MSWTQVGTASVGPQDQEVLVGSFSLAAGDDTLWVRMQQTDPETPWRWAYGIITWKSSFGKELGSVKAYGDTASEVYRLGNGQPPVDRNGSIYFRPRAYNNRWISVKDPQTWSLNFEAQSGVLTVGATGDGVGASLGSFADFDNSGVSWAIRDGFARVSLTN